MTARVSDAETEEILVAQDGPVLWVHFNRPEQHNALTWHMYEQLLASCERADSSPDVRVLALTGSGRAFAAGTDITQFAGFADDPVRQGIEYEQRVEHVLERLGEVDVPTVAVINGYCVGAGLAIAASCDLRIASVGSRFGAPIARTLGNCLARRTVRLLVDRLGTSRTVDLVLRARLLSADDALAAGFVSELHDPGDLAEAARALTAQLGSHAPLTMWALKEMVRRIEGRGGRSGPAVDHDIDVLERVYGSSDFGAGVAAFGTKQAVAWTGR